MTRRGIKQENPQIEEIEEVIMPSSARPKRKSRADTNGEDLEMLEAPTISTSSFPAMPTPSSFADDGPAEVTVNGRQQYSGPSK
jgi:hypothetical protein